MPKTLVHLSTYYMAGSKRQKVKNLLSPNSSTPPPPPPDESDGLVDDLLAQLSSRDQTVQAEATSVLRDVQATELDAANNQQTKAGYNRSRFDARQVRLSIALYG